MQEVQDRSSVQIDNYAYTNANAIQIRLDTSQILQQIKSFLEGKYIEPSQDPTTGEISWNEISSGQPKANTQGIQALMGYLHSVVNTGVVQGNLDRDQYDMYLYHFHKKLLKMTMLNLYRWDINPYEYPLITSHIMNTVEPFLSRTINDGERNSYAKSLQHSERSSVSTPNTSSGGIASWIKGG